MCCVHSGLVTYGVVSDVEVGCDGFILENLDISGYARYNGMMTSHKEKCCLCRAVTIIDIRLRCIILQHIIK